MRLTEQELREIEAEAEARAGAVREAARKHANWVARTEKKRQMPDPDAE